MLERERCAKLSASVLAAYGNSLGEPLVRFLFSLKQRGDRLYRKFLNPHGDGRFSRFRLSDTEVAAQRGLYAYSVDDEVQYIGRCLDSFAKRIDNGYGRIHPKACHLVGQSTNCHLNSLVTGQPGSRVTLSVCPLDDEQLIIEMESLLLRRYRPAWNHQLS